MVAEYRVVKTVSQSFYYEVGGWNIHVGHPHRQKVVA